MPLRNLNLYCILFFDMWLSYVLIFLLLCKFDVNKIFVE